MTQHMLLSLSYSLPNTDIRSAAGVDKQTRLHVHGNTVRVRERGHEANPPHFQSKRPDAKGHLTLSISLFPSRLESIADYVLVCCIAESGALLLCGLMNTRRPLTPGHQIEHSWKNTGRGFRTG